ncbi:hypothetical protein MnTg03_00232 [bacterium MnTg03]|nr:hypothetical protein MnTg03_00232 [bacterium MnTg03]
MPVGSMGSGLEVGTNDWLQGQLDRKQGIIKPVYFGLIGTNLCINENWGHSLFPRSDSVA